MLAPSGTVRVTLTLSKVDALRAPVPDATHRPTCAIGAIGTVATPARDQLPSAPVAETYPVKVLPFRTSLTQYGAATPAVGEEVTAAPAAARDWKSAPPAGVSTRPAKAVPAPVPSRNITPACAPAP